MRERRDYIYDGLKTALIRTYKRMIIQKDDISTETLIFDQGVRKYAIVTASMIFDQFLRY